MNRAFFVVALLIGLVGLGRPTAAEAQVPCDVPTSSADDALNRIALARADCFGGERDTDALAKRIVDTTRPPTTPAADQFCTPSNRTDLEKVRATLAQFMRDIDRDLLTKASSIPTSWTPLIAIVSSELRTAEATLETTTGIAQPVYWQWAGHQTFQGVDGLFLLNYEPTLREACRTSSDDCRAAVSGAIEVNRAVGLAARTNRCAVESRLRDSAAQLAKLDEQWNNYFFKAHSQYIWELGINSRRFKARDDIFAPPPTDQLIVLHPEAAFEYVGTDPQNERAYEAIVMTEVIGYNKLSWRNSQSRLPPLGASLVVTHTPDNTGDRSGYGFLVHIRNTFSFGATRRDTGSGEEETTYLLSADFMQLLLEPSQKRMKSFRGDGAPPAANN